MRKYEKLGAEIFAICTKAKQKCRTMVDGNHQWSPKLDKAIKEMAYWRACGKYTENNTMVTKLVEEIGLQYEFQTQDEIQKMINHSREKLTEIQINSIQYRQQHLEDLTGTYEAENNITKLTAIKELVAHESTRRIFSILQEKLKNTNAGQLNELLISYNIVKGNISKINPTNESLAIRRIFIPSS